MFSFDNLIQGVIIFLGLFMPFFWLTGKPVDKTVNIIIIFLLALSLQMLGLMLISVGWGGNFLVRFNIAYGFIYGVILYYYTKHTLYANFTITRKEWLHFFPFTLAIFYAGTNAPIHYPLIYILYFASALTYFWLSGRVITRYRIIIVSTRSRLFVHKLQWLRWLFIIYLLVLICDTLQFTFSYFYPHHAFTGVIQSITFVLVLFLVSSIVYYSLLYPNLYIAALQDEVEIVTRAEEDPPADQSEFFAIGERLEGLMSTEKLYLNPDLMLVDVSRQLQITPRLLSRTIRVVFSTNFSAYINSHRVDEAIHLLQQANDPKETVSEIMYKVGFSTKSAFFAAFKRKTGLSPKQFRLSSGSVD